MRPVAAPTVALILVANGQRPDDARGPHGDLGGGQGAVSEELGRVEGVGEPGGDGVIFGYRESW
jgi:hypothetical protein